jgi:hypothetical protein
MRPQRSNLFILAAALLVYIILNQYHSQQTELLNSALRNQTQQVQDLKEYSKHWTLIIINSLLEFSGKLFIFFQSRVWS